jgi:hypothetical protein
MNFAVGWQCKNETIIFHYSIQMKQTLLTLRTNLKKLITCNKTATRQFYIFTPLHKSMHSKQADMSIYIYTKIVHSNVKCPIKVQVHVKLVMSLFEV